jgi:hypothetical protein
MKFKALLAAAAALSLAVPGSAQQQGPHFSPEAFRAHVAFLADDLLEGREAGTRGYDLAARYVAAQFEALGLTPAVDGGWYQPVELVRFGASGVPQISIGARSIAPEQGMVVRASADTEPLSLDAPLVFVGYGIDLPARGFDDYAGLDVRGKVVVVLTGTPAGTPSDVAAHLNSEKGRMAAGRGAAGMITLRGRGESTPWARMTAAMARPSTTWAEPNGQPFVASGLRFNAIADGEAAQALFEGARRSFDQVRADAERPGRAMRGFALTPRLRVQRAAPEIQRMRSANVVGLIPGSDPALANEYVLLTAHLDGLGVREGGDGDRIRNGAMDNATGIATLIEVARQLQRDPTRPRRPILIAAVTAEEKGLLGAEYLARHPVTGQGRVVSDVNLDMPILTYDFSDVIAFGAEHSTMGEIVARAAARMNVALTPDPLPQESLFVRSDHYKFVREGVPSVFLMTGFAGEGRRRFTGFLGEEYHSPRDDMTLPFNWNTGARFAELNYRIAREIADSDQAPRWYADSFFGHVFGGGQARAQRPSGSQQNAAPR